MLDWLLDAERLGQRLDWSPTAVGTHERLHCGRHVLQQHGRRLSRVINLIQPAPVHLDFMLLLLSVVARANELVHYVAFAVVRHVQKQLLINFKRSVGVKLEPARVCLLAFARDEVLYLKHPVRCRGGNLCRPAPLHSELIASVIPYIGIQDEISDVKLRVASPFMAPRAFCHDARAAALLLAVRQCILLRATCSCSMCWRCLVRISSSVEICMGTGTAIWSSGLMA